MKKALHTYIIIIFATLTGCATDGHIYNANGACLTCFNNPFSGEPINHEGSQQKTNTAHTAATTPKKPIQMHQVSFDTPVNVDIAFIKLKREFEFLSVEEVKNEWGYAAEFKLKASDYYWEAYPSVSYTMGSARKLLNSHMNLKIVVDKKTDQDSKISAYYWPRNDSIDPQEIGNYLRERISKAIGS